MDESSRFEVRRLEKPHGDNREYSHEVVLRVVFPGDAFPDLLQPLNIRGPEFAMAAVAQRLNASQPGA